MIFQRTVQKMVKSTGVGLHSGNKVTLCIMPAPVNSGIVLRRTDLTPAVEIPAKANLVRETTMCTALVNDEGVRISTIEHLFAALAGLGIDNAVIEVDAPEIPIMDGSASPFVFLLQSAGIKEQSVAKKYIKINQTIRVEDGDKWAELKPYKGFRVDFKIDFNHPEISRSQQHMVMDFSTSAFVKDISRARTFGFMQDIEYLRANNLALGGSMENAVVLDEYRVLNPDGLRYEDEFVKHKILDAFGDLYVAGHAIVGEFCAYKTGHALNNQLVRALLAQQEAWELVSFENEVDVPLSFMVPGATSLA
ncbi:UDP-3-O-acyl-N-acetylglucosamine deacetylase [Shewanella sp. 1_MG-2023]|uniref:UDP-3-O-acyl-N-acetylglucosamine deacetylase n=1 Tax=Shewanella electrodiphila TaxID=934143 RepID=A0ABT0KUG8_9GAMM|nr:MULTISPECIES: UDP-3-O-acyl-N-acetylglucosamine deacetylase [Shewanella]MCC4833531.1 UDP-3-O-acyl-N-acetylglucosamine deacetylase [Shewanella sp. 10N.7]MCL1047487.1 UDP-3-O-acyl-N-acetylglucosamine deacetylase [Shewanella electrodiphila]MDO6613023.1 UDP-3-O-acyl-N-acetylglucosamine deacetylase [Shewanella sp. 7_MG-2023]MDO6772797.1 UDP-3-O-acyl-N-acetylglucosamine deacetylase [Shewanella sp. 2_MG-2023]MDO6795155.1 UDP-3-O-acyl-N-acetylglucosamine deacetylase [Shewanella sp. 1_MG-2023]